ncbi:hypothetical protein BH23PSE1_BH23PSE1_02610 [soil metagenome]
MGLWWIIGFAAAALVVVVVAALLIGILHQARRIRGLARAAIGVVGEIEANTRAAWALGATNAVAGELVEGARAIEGNVAAINTALAGGEDAEDAA